jgi:hypothetical protein
MRRLMLVGAVASLGALSSVITGQAATAACTTWSQQPANLTDYAVLNGVSVASPNLAWTVGVTFSSRGVESGLIEKWNGTSWSVVDEDESDVFNAVASFGAQHAVAVGSEHDRPAIATWNGSTWTSTTLPIDNAFFASVSGTSASDVWAVGGYGRGRTRQSKALLEHWNGSTWTQANVPTDLLSTMRQVVDVAPNNVYALSIRHQFVAYIWHFDGTAWTPISRVAGFDPPVPAAIAATPSDLWYAPRGASFVSQYHLEHWNGTGWAPVDTTYYANVASLATGANGTLWSAGKTRGGSFIYLARDAHRVTTPEVKGTLKAVATGFGLGFAIGESNAGPIILGGCDS